MDQQKQTGRVVNQPLCNDVACDSYSTNRTWFWLRFQANSSALMQWHVWRVSRAVSLLECSANLFFSYLIDLELLITSLALVFKLFNFSCDCPIESQAIELFSCVSPKLDKPSICHNLLSAMPSLARALMPEHVFYYEEKSSLWTIFFSRVSG